jgi:hypothetical protein
MNRKGPRTVDITKIIISITQIEIQLRDTLGYNQSNTVGSVNLSGLRNLGSRRLKCGEH